MPERDGQDPGAPSAREDDLALLIEAAREAGDIAMAFTAGNLDFWDKPGDQGPVTEADLAVNDALRKRLTQARPAYGWLSEESPDDPARLAARRVFIIDPIDGTRSFMDGQSAWAHSIAVADQGVVTAGVVFLPVLDRMFAAARGRGATLNGTALTCSARTDPEGATILAAKPSFAAGHWQGAVPGFSRHQRPALAYRLSLVAQGRFDAMLTLRPSWEWDIAAGSLIAEEAGARISDRDGQPLRFNSATALLNGVIAAGPALHGDIAARLVPSAPLPATPRPPFE
ncbi:inositol monophosphatase family protein [Pseudooceanicola algae]|uniref:Inositol-1-monophosphatase n=1 Tax=Pseudooceanicola algae TaxID=1537215 RepID=A0A418SGD1_9RHOB|nr:3'(2'),5'-bisphosphate nucleotidase CysQ [Pseudooceanicola algae]QPM91591.1 Inositol-1-monophosphatase [Pseudooceanicola algae]